MKLFEHTDVVSPALFLRKTTDLTTDKEACAVFLKVNIAAPFREDQKMKLLM